MAKKWAVKDGRQVIMVRPETKPDDVHGMLAAEGILTSRGGRTSHAALVARQFGKPAVVGVAALKIDIGARQIRVNDQIIKEGDWISINGTVGEIDELLEQIKERDRVLKRVESLREDNPMLGTRGVRLGIHIPELTTMQVRAIFEVACTVKKVGVDVRPDNPFATIDRDGVGELMDMAVKKGRAVNPELECGICGEHGGDPQSIAICHQLG